MDPARGRRLAAFVTCMACAAVAAGHVSAQAPTRTPAPTFRSGVTGVEVDAVVTDASGRFVPGLEVSDFVLLEDGQPRPISAFSLVDLPIGVPGAAAARADAGSPDTVSNEDARPGRVFVVVLDDLHTAPFLSERTRTIVRRFVEGYMGPDDRVAVLSTSRRSRITADFTSSHEVLLAAVERFLGRRPSWTAPAGTPTSRAACFT